MSKQNLVSVHFFTRFHYLNKEETKHKICLHDGIVEKKLTSKAMFYVKNDQAGCGCSNRVSGK